jgi:hypothetical protein
MHHPRFLALLIFLATLLGTTVPARADGPFTIGLGESLAFQSQARQIGGTAQLNLTASLDMGNIKQFPLRNSVMFDYSGGSANGGSLSSYGLGFGTRLNSPAYIGAGAMLYNVTANQGPVLGSRSTISFGSNIFVGQRIANVPGVGPAFAVQLTYRQIPAVNGINPSGLAATFRVSL